MYASISQSDGTRYDYKYFCDYDSGSFSDSRDLFLQFGHYVTALNTSYYIENHYPSYQLQFGSVAMYRERLPLSSTMNEKDLQIAEPACVVLDSCDYDICGDVIGKWRYPTDFGHFSIASE